jgi:hypothetical protein
MIKVTQVGTMIKVIKDERMNEPRGGRRIKPPPAPHDS